MIYTFCLLSNLQEAPCRHLSITRMAEEQPGFYCSTSGTFFADKVLKAVFVTLLADLEPLAHYLKSWPCLYITASI